MFPAILAMQQARKGEEAGQQAGQEQAVQSDSQLDQADGPFGDTLGGEPFLTGSAWRLLSIKATTGLR